ncbi:hypothetical protein SAMN04488558_10614 [Ignavigranum ruoffiae]|uniref:Uncharacterized protein n=1 Tax=Ignavigranum ruoffiae TaxID=89093 RepID=A0A1H9DU88_9LACT|nr:hypothetical protein [Ignavigranum ruoffiae]SEQ17049.1 hypothetical protein SAMN04488558_10614 [Ignavigranum ruoffiae]
MNDKEKKIALEQEISKQLGQMDERFDRSGWFYIVVLIILLFVALATFMYFSNTVPETPSGSIEEMDQRIESLEERVKELEEQIESEA